MRFFIVFIFLGLSTVASAQTHFSFLQYMPPTVDPVAAIETNSQFLITNSFDGLVSWDAENGLSPMLAQKWSFSSDRKLVTFYLRKAFFSDGSAFTPVDVVNHFNRLKKSAYFKDHFKNIVETTASSDGAVVFKLKNPSPHFLHLLAGSHSRIVKKIGANIVGIGPFIPTLKKDEALLERNSNYWGEKANVAMIELKVLAPDAAFKAIRLGQLDDMVLNPGSTDDKEKNSEGKWLEQPMWATWAIALDRKLFDDVKVRENLLLAMPSREVLSIYPGNFEAFGIQAFGMPGYIDKLPSSSGAANKKGGPKKIVKIFVPQEMPKVDEFETWLKNKKLDCCEIQPVKKEFTKIIEQVGKGGFGAYLISFNPEYPDPSFLIRALQSRLDSNYLRLSDKGIDALIEQMNKTDDSVERAKIMTKINQQIMQEASLIPLMHVVHHAFTRRCVSGITLNPVSEGYFSLRKLENRCR